MILLIALPDRQIDALTRTLTSSGVPLLTLDPRLEGKQAITLSSEALWIDHERLDPGETSVLIHGLSYADPVIPREPLLWDWFVWQVDYVAEQQRFSTCWSLLYELERRGASLYNPPDAYVDVFMLPALLSEIERAGFQVPARLLTNASEEAERFELRHPEVVWRPATGSGPWQRWTGKQRRALTGEGKPPVLLAEVRQGPLLRTYFCGTFQLTLAYRPPRRTPWEELEWVERFLLPEELQNTLARIITHLGWRWGELLFVLEDGVPWLYDLSPDPCYAWLPEPYFSTFTEAIAAVLLGRAMPELPTGPARRATPFTRRMLDILFTLEASKYMDMEK